MAGLVSLYWGQAAGFLAGLFMVLSPLFVYFGRAFIDDVPSLSFALAGLWGIATWAKTDSRRALVLGIAAITLAVLIKPVALYIYFPVVAVLWERWEWRALRRPEAWAIMILPLLPNLAWYAWARQIGQQYLTFGLGGSATSESQDYIAFSKWGSVDFVLSRLFLEQMARRLWREILLHAGMIALVLGLGAFVRWRLPGRLVIAALLFGVLLFTAVSARAQWVHNYYQLPLAAGLAPFIGLGLAALWHGGNPLPSAQQSHPRPLRQRLSQWAALALVLWLAVFSARKLPIYYHDWQGWIPDEVALVQTLTAPTDRIVTVAFDGSPTLLYHLHRPGWVADYLNPDSLAQVPGYIDRGAQLVILQDLHRRGCEALYDQSWITDLDLIERTPYYAIYRVSQGP
jgi:4-amino-4-deoxy-L-arabinose transferase-like glycosyltransferase